MKVTCSILCYNYGRFLAQAIESCLSQKPGDYELEVLVIDDGSTDETPEVCQDYQGRIRVLRSENQGFGASLDKAIAEASGDYVCLLDADDYFDTNKILTLLPFMQKGYLYIEHTKYFIDSDGKLINSTVHGGGNTSTLCINRTAALSLLPIQNEIFFHPLKSAGHGIEISQPLSFYRFHGNNMTNYKQPDAQYSYLARVTHTLADQLLSMSQNPPFWVDSYTLEKISRDYRAIAYYDEMEAALLKDKWGKVLLACIRIILAALRSRTGLTIWHCKVIIRGLVLRKPIELKPAS
ncbi:glycosyltransferase family 2 protein [Pelatocladus sp. BLCC-F211]|uniref:glycosyltransferase family 2 protein n=1 Tax=Pelatocladus sp. BLCC-F211 TaxID=3342752 RepID=UPI0035B9935D